jgi:hypothetical protein
MRHFERPSPSFDFKQVCCCKVRSIEIILALVILLVVSLFLVEILESNCGVTKTHHP